MISKYSQKREEFSQNFINEEKQKVRKYILKTWDVTGLPYHVCIYYFPRNVKKVGAYFPFGLDIVRQYRILIIKVSPY